MDALAAERPPPEDPLKRKKVESLRKSLDEVKALLKASKYKEGLQLAEKSMEEAKGLDYKPVEVEAMYWLASLLGAVGKNEESAKTLTDTAALADGAKHDEIRAQANISLLFVLGYRLARFDEVEPLIKRSKFVKGLS